MPVKDDSLVAQYIRNIENPDSIGFRDGMWFQSPRKVDDPNNRGFGVDIRFNEAKELVKGRPGKYLTEEEERTLRNNYISSMEGVLNKWTPKVLQEIPSEAKKAMATGMLYRGDGVKSIIKDPALRDAYYSGTDEQFQKAVSNYYNSKGTKHYQPERAKQHNKFMDSHTQEGFNWDNSFKPVSSLFGKGGLLEPKDEWDKLSMAAKAEMMRVAVNHGIYDLQTIRQKYNEFAEGGKKEDEQYYSTMEKVAEDNYKDWGFSNSDEALVHALNDNTYNYRDFYRKYPWSEANATTHWTDEFKTVWHPTFSNESIYSGQKSQYNPLGLPGGFWSGDTFIPMAWQLDANEYKKGGDIYIKPSHRGRLTELKKRTGKTEAELYRTGSPATRKMITFARNARKWKHGLGGNLFAPGGEITYGKPFYSYDENGQKIDNTLNYNATIPEVVIIPDSRKTPAQRNEDERFRQRSLKDYDEVKSKEFTAKQVLQSQKDWENSFEKQALNYAQAAATGMGIGTDIVSGLPIYSSLKGASVLRQAETPMDYVEGGLWLAPVLGGAYQTTKPAVRQALNLFKTDSPSSDLAGITQHSISNTTKPSGLQETQQAAERGRNKLLDWVNSSFYKQRIEEEPFYRFSNDIVDEASSLVENAPLGFDKTIREIHPSGQITGETVTRPALKIRDDGYRVFDLNTGLDVNIGSDLGNEAEDVTLHELLHYLTVNSKGIPESTSTVQIVDKGWMQPLEALFNPVGKNILRGKKWQSYILDQNDALLPKYDTVVDMVIHRPEEAKAALLKAGRTKAEADVAIKSLKDRYEYWSDIQEQRAHLQELFISKIKPHLKNPNDAAEIEAFLTQHPDILESSSPYNFIQEVRPGSLKQYSKYFASALGTLPFIMTNNNE